VRKSLFDLKLEEIKKFVDEGHTYEEAMDKFNVRRGVVLRAINPMIIRKDTWKLIAIAGIAYALFVGGLVGYFVASRGSILHNDETGVKVGTITSIDYAAGVSNRVVIHFDDNSTLTLMASSDRRLDLQRNVEFGKEYVIVYRIREYWSDELFGVWRT